MQMQMKIEKEERRRGEERRRALVFRTRVTACQSDLQPAAGTLQGDVFPRPPARPAAADRRQRGWGRWEPPGDSKSH